MLLVVGNGYSADHCCFLSYLSNFISIIVIGNLIISGTILGHCRMGMGLIAYDKGISDAASSNLSGDGLKVSDYLSCVKNFIRTPSKEKHYSEIETV